MNLIQFSIADMYVNLQDTVVFSEIHGYACSCSQQKRRKKQNDQLIVVKCQRQRNQTITSHSTTNIVKWVWQYSCRQQQFIHIFYVLNIILISFKA